MPVDVVARVIENQPLGGGYFMTTVSAPAIASSCAPGQFVMAGSLDPSELLLRRPFSICLRSGNRPGELDSIMLLYRVLGRGTAFLSRLAPGDSVAVLGPLGRGFSSPAPGETPVIVAGGVGVAAFPFLIETLRESAASTILFYGGRTADDLPMLDWLRERTARTVVTTDDGSLGEKGLVTAPLARFLASGRLRDGDPSEGTAGGASRGTGFAPGGGTGGAAAGGAGSGTRGATGGETTGAAAARRPSRASEATEAGRAVSGNRQGSLRLYVCGPHPMMRAVAAIAAEHHVACEVALETPMACGYGVCVGCVVEVNRFAGEYGRYRRVCVDGPVFDATEIAW